MTVMTMKFTLNTPKYGAPAGKALAGLCFAVSDHEDIVDLDDLDDHDDHDEPVVEDALTGGGHSSSQQRHPGLHFEELTVIHARAYQYQYIPCSNSNAFLSFNCWDAVRSSYNF